MRKVLTNKQGVSPKTLAEKQKAKQEQNKTALAAFLSANPMPWSNGKYYGVTEEDQNEIALNILQYQMAVGAGVTATLEWHAVHEECTVWTLEELTALTIAISSFVYPYMQQMKSIKAAIYNATTVAELEAIGIEYAIMEENP